MMTIQLALKYRYVSMMHFDCCLPEKIQEGS